MTYAASKRRIRVAADEQLMSIRAWNVLRNHVPGWQDDWTPEQQWIQTRAWFTNLGRTAVRGMGRASRGEIRDWLDTTWLPGPDDELSVPAPHDA